ncbi:hypothetical protein FZI85_16160 [Mycobacterium sp. CBMA293]|nr:hypothetical protein [Mycolicibacterium sp. CBMA 360]MUL57274.1 hypothetical protein [Mycolicibacterium sp. CBMA 335]MUL70314.1 hypothetical protein [Mycolicibacterium sp. CBMA 311]MUL92362.1 hypothetical protein [Mycolicibacterium sp. CBMA 230]MUM06783.1 hypothetical protein [Mycolicibacterium sp. CBMA 213]MUM12555.1 hypothetical protein [Mycolicibacterium sp. CBMA 293]
METSSAKRPAATDPVSDRTEQVTAEARRRYHVYLASAFGDKGFQDAHALADLALDLLTDWRNIDTGAPCRCSCHPQLPASDRHDYGFDCMCTKTREERKRIFDDLRYDSEEFWQSPEGQSIVAAKRAEDAELHEWLAEQADVTAHADGDFAPEVWHGEVAGRRFYFRERGGQWRIEIDLRPTGWCVPTVVALAASGEPRIEQCEVEEGDVIAHGDTAETGYGTTPRERVQFIVGKVRQHLAQASCTLHASDLSAVESVLGAQVQWCPSCGIRLGS